MRIVATADWHLGFRAYQRVTAGGLNVRERDVAQTFTRLIDGMIAVKPDVILVAGDIFHTVRPGNPAITHAFRQLSKLRSALPDTLVVLVAGNHDAPKASESGCILPLFANLGIQIVDSGAERITHGDLSILCVPDMPGMKWPELAPDRTARFNVLLLHGEMSGVKQSGGTRHASHEISESGFHADDWDYCALGHFHQYEEIAPNCYYSGSIDFTSSNPWQEIATPKGFIEHDLETGRHTFHELPHSRPIVNLPAMDAHEVGAEDLTERIRATLTDAAIDGKIVRLVVNGVSKEVARALDQKMIRDFKARALYLGLDLRRPDEAVAIGAPRVVVKRQTLEERMASMVLDATRSMPVDVDRARVVEWANKYLETAVDPYTGETIAQQEADSARLTERLTQSLIAEAHRAAA